MSFAIRTYVGQDEWGNKKCLAHMNFGNDTYMSFFGVTEEEAKTKALSWYEAERVRWGKIGLAPENVDEKHLSPIVDPWAALKPEGRGHHFVGKVWMLNKNNHKVRVDAAEQSGYEAKGYKLGGPRSTWKE